MARLARMILTVLLALSTATVLASEAPFEPLLLFMERDDAYAPVGVLSFQANPLEERAAIELAEGVSAEGGQGRRAPRFHPLLAIPTGEGDSYVFGCTHHEDPGTEPRTFLWQLYRGRTPDGYRLTEWKEVFRNPEEIPWLIESALVHQQATDELFFFTWSRHDQPEEGHALWGFSSGDGLDWQPLADRPIYVDHDAFGSMWDPHTGRFLTAQVTYQPWEKLYPDNIGPYQRRVLSIMTSRDGLEWERQVDAGPGGLITPDADDTPDLEFYRMQPFRYGDRYVAMANLYTPSLIMPDVHGPHLGCEWWVSADGVRWNRPWRDVDAHGNAPYPVKMAPMWFGREMLFWTSGVVMGLPEYRLASIGARSNAEFSSRAIEMPDRPLLLNASVPIGRGLFNQAYVAVEIRDASGNVIPGYEYDKCILQGVDDTRIPLSWEGRDGTELAGQKVQFRFYLRSARIYAIGL